MLERKVKGTAFQPTILMGRLARTLDCVLFSEITSRHDLLLLVLLRALTEGSVNNFSAVVFLIALLRRLIQEGAYTPPNSKESGLEHFTNLLSSTIGPRFVHIIRVGIMDRKDSKKSYVCHTRKHFLLLCARDRNIF